MQNLINNLAAIIESDDVNIPKGNPTAAMPTILQIVFAVAGGTALLIIAIAGLRMVMSQGNPEGFSRARNTVIYALIGLVVCVSAFAIVTFVIGRI